MFAAPRAPAAGFVRRRWQGLQWHPLTPLALLEAWTERVGGHAASPDHGPHLDSALAWLAAAQDATPDAGFSRGYSLVWHPLFGRGWQPSYPETTGYIIPTLYEAARDLGRPDLAQRAARAARWEIEIQLPNGGVPAGVVGASQAPAVFNTGQVIFGWLAAFNATGDGAFADAALRAGTYLVSRLGDDGLWSTDNSPFAGRSTTLYNARTAWALAEAGARLGRTDFGDAAACNLWAVARAQHVNGWIPDCCLTDGVRPLLHTIAYAARGLLEGGRVLHDDRLVRHAIAAAEPLLHLVRRDGRMPGRLRSDWSPAVPWSCLTGQAQMVNLWLRAYVLTGDAKWIEPVPSVLRFLKATQNRSSGSLGVRGGIRGSAPIHGEYGRYEILNWATKFFADALLRHERIRTGRATRETEWATLA